MPTFGKLGMNHMEFGDAHFLDWLEARVASTPNTQKLKVKRKHIVRLRTIQGIGTNIGCHGGAMKLTSITKWISDARAAITSRVVSKLAPNTGTVVQDFGR